MSQGLTLPGIGSLDPSRIQKEFEKWLKTQPPAVEVAVLTIQSALTGAGFGYLLGSMSNMEPPAAADAVANPMAAQMKALNAGGPWVQARNLAVLMGTNAGLTAAIRKFRNGKEDVYSSMGASFGSGFMYSLVSGSPNPFQAALTTGMAFALFNGLFYQIGQMFKPEHGESEYDRAHYMLKTLGLQKYQDNLKKQLLTDKTIMLWNDVALAEARIPAGPRLLILHHLDQFRNPSAFLKPALPLPPLPPPVEATASAGSAIAARR